MIHARKDYDRIQDPALTDPSLLGEGCAPIAEDEPVFLLRAKDKHFTRMLIHYLILLANDEEVTVDVPAAVYAHLQTARHWQAEHGTKSPDLPKGGDQ